MAKNFGYTKLTNKKVTPYVPVGTKKTRYKVTGKGPEGKIKTQYMGEKTFKHVYGKPPKKK